MTDIRYTVFETEWGPCALAWSRWGICALVLPAGSKSRPDRKIEELCPGAAPGDPSEVAEYTDMLQAYFRGEPVELRAKLDLSWATPFQSKVYRTLTRIPAGETWSYGYVADKAGVPGAARAVGAANAGNRVPLFIPCHRVVKADGATGGFSAPGGTKLKQKLLDLERNSIST
ncbi:MAG: methylated-DNA--[protein]-cysteine S-methyltransferase [bacterium]